MRSLRTSPGSAATFSTSNIVVFLVLSSSACGSEEQLLEYQPHCPPELCLWSHMMQKEKDQVEFIFHQLRKKLEE